MLQTKFLPQRTVVAGWTMAETERGERLQIMLTPDELKALDDWRFARRMPSRAAAVRDLLRRGLAAEGVGVAETGKASRNFGVLPEPPAARGKARASARPSAGD
jgi:plasmid stability protein